MSSRAKFVAGGIVVLGAVGALLWLLLSGALGEFAQVAFASKYLKIEEIKALGPDQARSSRVAGKIVADSVHWSLEELRLTFVISDATGTLPISYHGPKPDMLVDAVEAVAIGRFDPAAGVFEAEELLMKCPSKYEATQP